MVCITHGNISVPLVDHNCSLAKPVSPLQFGSHCLHSVLPPQVNSCVNYSGVYSDFERGKCIKIEISTRHIFIFSYHTAFIGTQFLQ